VWCGDKIAKPKPGKGIGFAQCPANDQFFALCHEINAVFIGKVGVGFIDHKRTGKFLGNFQNPLLRNDRA
jgi:hypothetical protein